MSCGDSAFQSPSYKVTVFRMDRMSCLYRHNRLDFRFANAKLNLWNEKCFNSTVVLR